ncbi:hypothetical protein EV356DRAFT_514176 [Viridothelium virens]|uniref:Uncharacterized protein n=1 Tax=Viridothelium virens TaxID=1048519 RepID=A0A6A6HCT7_VIRVR|nr:hypothetical protein EV356DRAFT_514176 [Viridothelium virens]
MYNIKTLGALVAFFLAASSSAQTPAQGQPQAPSNGQPSAPGQSSSQNSTQPLAPGQGQSQGSILSPQALQSLSCQNARDSAVGGTSAANILLTNALTGANSFDAASGTASAVVAAQKNLALSQPALSRIQTAALSGQPPSQQDMQAALQAFVGAAQNVNAALQLSSQGPPPQAGQPANASQPVLAAAMVPVITNLGPENKQLVVNLNTAGSQLTQSNVGNSALQLQEVQLAMRVMMTCSGTTTGNSTGSTGSSTGSTGGLTGGSTDNSTGNSGGSSGSTGGLMGGTGSATGTGSSTGTSTGTGQGQPQGQAPGAAGETPGSMGQMNGPSGQTTKAEDQPAGESSMKEKRRARLVFF